MAAVLSLPAVASEPPALRMSSTTDQYCFSASNAATALAAPDGLAAALEALADAVRPDGVREGAGVVEALAVEVLTDGAGVDVVGAWVEATGAWPWQATRLHADRIVSQRPTNTGQQVVVVSSWASVHFHPPSTQVSVATPLR